MLYLITTALILLANNHLISQNYSIEYPFTIVYSDDCKIGLNTLDGNTLLAAEYRTINPIQMGNNWLISTKNSTRKIAYLLKKKQLIPLSYPEVSKINDRWLRVGKKNSLGIVDTEGIGVALMQFKQLSPINISMVLSLTNSGYGLINDRGIVLLPNIYKKIIPWNNYGFWVKKNNTYALLNEAGKITFPEVYDSIKASNLDRCAVQKNKKWGIIDHQGRWIQAASYAAASIFENGLMATYQQNKWAILDLEGKRVLEKKVDSIKAAYPYLIVYNNHKAGLIDVTGTWILPCEYDAISSLNPRILQLTQHQEHYFYDIYQNTSSQGSYEAIKASAVDTLLLFKKEQRWGLISTKERIVVPAQYKQIKLSNFGLLEVASETNLLGILNHAGTTILPCNYKVILDQQHYFKVNKGTSTWFYLNNQQQILDCKHP